MHIENEHSTPNASKPQLTKIPLQSKGIEKKAQQPLPAHLKKAQRRPTEAPPSNKDKQKHAEGRTEALEESEALVNHIKALKENAANAASSLPRAFSSVTAPTTARPSSSSTDDHILTVEKGRPFTNPGEEIAVTRRNKQMLR